MNKDFIESVFQKTKVRYQELQDINVKLVFKSGLFFTMRTSTSLSSFLKEKRAYLVLVNTKRNNIISQLSEDDIIGWLAHELAHIIDYESMSNTGLVTFTFQYFFNSKFRSATEKRVNIIACQNGFTRELFGVWRKFLAMDDMPEWYKKYIIKNYLPDWKKVNSFAQEIGVTREDAIGSIPEQYKKYITQSDKYD